MSVVLRICGFAFRGAMWLLPSSLRTRHGEAMLALYLDELHQRHREGPWALWRAAFGGVLDVLIRGTYEHLRAERAAFTPASRAMMRRVVVVFLVAFVVLTDAMLANYMLQRRVSADLSLIVYAVPFTAALTVPMALFVAVLWVGTERRRKSNRALSMSDSASPRPAMRMAPVIALSVVASLLAFALNAELVPRANQRLMALLSGNPSVALSDRSMTLAQLRKASHRAAQSSPVAVDRNGYALQAQYDFEIHKKFALSAACLVLSLLAAGIARRVPHAGVGAQLLAALMVFGSYYILLMGGETLVDRGVIPPALGMWSANGLCLLAAWFTLRHGNQSPTAITPRFMPPSR